MEERDDYKRPPNGLYGPWWRAVSEDSSRCVAEVWASDWGHQCNRKRGHGPGGLYCKTARGQG